MSNVVPLRKSYEAKLFKVAWENTDIEVAGTLCGHVELAIPGIGSIPLTCDEALMLGATLIESREDVLKNSRPHDDPLLDKDHRS